MPSGCNFDDTDCAGHHSCGRMTVCSTRIHRRDSSARSCGAGEKAVIKPPRSKVDYDGTICLRRHRHCQCSTVATAPRAAASAARGPASGERRRRSSSPRRHSSRCPTPHWAATSNTCCVQTSRRCIKEYSCHSFRIGFACALLATSCPYAMIQALARWRSDRSVAIYARLTPLGVPGMGHQGHAADHHAPHNGAQAGDRRPQRGCHLPVGRGGCQLAAWAGSARPAR